MVYAGLSPQAERKAGPHVTTRIHLHLVSDSTGETLEMIAKAALAQFENADVVRHFWPMVRSRQHLDRIVPDLSADPGLVLYTLVNPETRERLEERCRTLGLSAVPVLDGGHILLSLVEWVRKKPVSVRVQEYATTVFAVLLLGFFLFVTLADVKRVPLLHDIFNRDTQIEQSAPGE